MAQKANRAVNATARRCGFLLSSSGPMEEDAPESRAVRVKR
jgi:hypothetical protein